VFSGVSSNYSLMRSASAAPNNGQIERQEIVSQSWVLVKDLGFHLAAPTEPSQRKARFSSEIARMRGTSWTASSMPSRPSAALVTMAMCGRVIVSHREPAHGGFIAHRRVSGPAMLAHKKRAMEVSRIEFARLFRNQLQISSAFRNRAQRCIVILAGFRDRKNPQRAIVQLRICSSAGCTSRASAIKLCSARMIR
jgi:hypothetical protein